jgi:uncharacterized protein (DUF488 family)
MNKYSTIYTVGHSNQTFEEFLSMIQSQGINVIVDVRSVPASKYTPQFNQAPLKAALLRSGINYLHFGDQFGARRTDAFDKDKKVDFELAVQTPAFLEGVERITNGINKGYKISLMCSEANPMECHRFAMISRYFHEHGFEVQHIVKQHDDTHGTTITTKTHEELQKEMISEYVRKKKVPQICPPDMFGENEVTKEKQVALAYRQKNNEIAYQEQKDNNENNQFL